jgi:MFS family permease
LVAKARTDVVESARVASDKHGVANDAGKIRSALLGAVTAMVYPTLLAAIGDVAYPLWRARAVGVYRLWRDSGYAAGAIVGGIAADLWGLRGAVWVAAAITVISGVVVALRMYETHPHGIR